MAHIKDHISEQQELLLMKLYDGECNWLEKRRATSLVSQSLAARHYFANLEKNSNSLSEWGKEFTRNPVDLWDKIKARISQEERLESVSTGASGIGVFASLLQNIWISRIGWSMSGAFVTALAGWMVVRAPTSSTYDVRSASSVDSIPLVINASEGEPMPMRSFHSKLELDWLRSTGKLSMIQDPAQRTTMLWVKRNRTAQQTPARLPLIIEER
jgi:hypothetical protein